MHLVVGLGNPGSKYEKTRHNIGFVIVDRFADVNRAGAFREKFKGVTTRTDTPEAVLLKPMTFMNLSGESVQPAQTFHKVALQNIVVIHDELDLPFGEVRIKVGGGSGGHNGLKSIIQHCGADFVRVRVGIGRPPTGVPVENYVLGGFMAVEGAALGDVVALGVQAIEGVLRDGVARAQNAMNTKTVNTKAKS